MNSVIRNVFAVILGLVVGAVVNSVLVAASPKVIAPPAGVDVNDIESVKNSMHLFEPKHFVFPFLAHALGTLAGALVAYLIAGSYRTVFAYVIGAVFFAGGITAALMISAPAWFVVLDLAGAYIPMAWLGARLGRRIKGSAGRSRV